jgi:hypothetical protein
MIATGVVRPLCMILALALAQQAGKGSGFIDI